MGDHITQDILALAGSRGVSRARFCIGDYLLREPDYLQTCDWAAAMGMAPGTLLNRKLDHKTLTKAARSNAYRDPFIISKGAYDRIASFLPEDGCLPTDL